MPALREILAKFGFDYDPSKIVSAKKGIEGFAENVKTLANKLSGGDLSGAVKDMISDLKDQAATIKTTANQLGIGIAEMQRWQGAAKLSGVAVESLNGAFRLLQKNAAAAAAKGGDVQQSFEDAGDGTLDASLGSKAAAQAFKDLGVEVTDASGQVKPVSQLMGDVGLAIGKIKNPAERTALAMKVFGRQGSVLIPLFNKGEAGLTQLLDKIDELGGGISEDAFKALAENSRASKEFDMATLSLKSAIAVELLPALTAKAKALTQIVSVMVRTSKGTNILKAAAIVLAGAFLFLQRQAIKSAISTAIAWAPTVIGFALLALILDDLLTAFQGGDSAIGKFGKKLLEAALGAKEAALLIEAAQKKFDGLSKGVDAQKTFGGKIEEVFSQVGAEIVTFIADDLPEFFSLLWTELGNSLSGGQEKITYSLKDMVGVFANVAKDAAMALVKGLVNGLNSGLIDIAVAVTGVGKEVEDKLRESLKWHSPSGLTFEAGFGGLDMGLVKGLRAGAPLIEKEAAATYALAMPENAAPSIRIPQARPGQVYSPRQVDSRNNITVKIQAGPGAAGMASAAREGIGQGLDDSLDGTLAALEALG